MYVLAKIIVFTLQSGADLALVFPFRFLSLNISKDAHPLQEKESLCSQFFVPVFKLVARVRLRLLATFFLPALFPLRLGRVDRYQSGKSMTSTDPPRTAKPSAC